MRQIAIYGKGGLAAGEAFRDIGAERLLADRIQLQFAE